MVKKSKADKVWAYKIKHPQSTTSEVAKATKTSYGYVYKLMQKIGTPKEVFEKEARRTTRGDVLDTAKSYVTKDRAADHGDMEDNFQRISDLWTAYLGFDLIITSKDVAVMMTLLKIARIKSNATHPDNWIDACGYMACGGEIASKG